MVAGQLWRTRAWANSGYAWLSAVLAESSFDLAVA